MDMPSEADMVLIARDGIQGCFGHWVFCHTGTYLVTLEPDLRARLSDARARGSKALDKEIRALKKGFEKVQDEFERGLQKGTLTLASFRQRWLRYAAEQGFRARFFAKNQTPQDMLVVRDLQV